MSESIESQPTTRSTPADVKIRCHNHGIDLLREISMLMICMVHILGQGGVITFSPPLGKHYIVAKLIETTVICGVNCFALISGFVKSTSTIRLRSLFRLWAEVVFYSFTLGLVYYFISPGDIPIKDIIQNLFPVSMLRYWYFSAYVILFISMPFLNIVIHNMSMVELRNTLLLIFITVCLFRCLPMLSNIGREFKEGFSSLWLMYLYIIGAFIRKYGLKRLLYLDSPMFNQMPFVRKSGFFKNWFSFFIFFLCVLISWGITILAEFINIHYIHKNFHFSFLTLYVSPTIVIAAIMLLHHFSHLHLDKRIASIISFLSPMTFSIYLIQSQHEIWRLLFKDAFTWITRYPSYLMPFIVLLSALSIFFICIVIDYMRIILFKILRIV